MVQDKRPVPLRRAPNGGCQGLIFGPNGSQSPLEVPENGRQATSSIWCAIGIEVKDLEDTPPCSLLIPSDSFPINAMSEIDAEPAITNANPPVRIPKRIDVPFMKREKQFTILAHPVLVPPQQPQIDALSAHRPPAVHVLDCRGHSRASETIPTPLTPE